MNFIHIPDNQQIAGLFLKHHMQDTTEEEEKILLDWANESQENRACYNRFMDEDWVFTQLAQFDEPDIELAIHNVDQKIAKQRVRRRISIIRAVLLAAVITGVVLMLLPLWNEKAAFNETTTVARQTIKAPANAPFGKALLVIGDEALIDLDTVKDGLIGEFGDVRIEKTKQVIRYKSMGNSPTGGSVYSKLITGQACQYQVILPDNSAVDLSASSWLRQGIVPNAQERRVEMAGRAFFDVTHDKKPFFVTVGEAEVQVMGTQFNVYAYDRDGVFKTALVKGHVKIKSGDCKADLFPGQTATIIPGQPIQTQEGNIEKEVGWKQGEFVFDHDNITTVMGELSRWYDLEVNYIGKPPTGSITCKIERTPDLDKALRLLSGLHIVSLQRDSVNKKLVTVSAWKD